MLISLLISTAAFVLVFFITYGIACVISPPYIVEENGARHGLMPIGQMLMGVLMASISSIVLLIVCYKKLKKKAQ